MKLVNSDHGGRRIVDCRRQRLERDVDDNSVRKSWILLHRPLKPEGNRRAQIPFIKRSRPAVQFEKRFVSCNKVANLRYKLDHAV